MDVGAARQRDDHITLVQHTRLLQALKHFFKVESGTHTVVLDVFVERQVQPLVQIAELAYNKFGGRCDIAS